MSPEEDNQENEELQKQDQAETEIITRGGDTATHFEVVSISNTKAEHTDLKAIETLEIQEQITNIVVDEDTAEVVEIIVTDDEKVIKKEKRVKRKPAKKPLIKIFSKSYVLEDEGTDYDISNIGLNFPSLSSLYETNFYGHTHINFIAQDEENGGFIVISLLPIANKDTEVNCIIRGKDGDIGLLIPIPDVQPKNPPQWKRLLRNEPEFNEVVDEDIKLLFVTDPQFYDDCLELEQKLCRRNFKVGVVYCTDDQITQEEMLSNDNGSKQFDEFLDLLGKRIRLKNWDKYDGGLDVIDDQTGTHSVFTTYNNCNLMFHVSTLLPPCEGDEEKIKEKKIHIGNDIVVIVFVDGEATFNPKKFVSKFNHVFIIVKPEPGDKTMYRINVIHKNGMEPATPYIPADSVFEKTTELRQLLLAKIINSENCACESSEQLAISFATLRYHLLHHIFLKYKPKPKQGCIGGCAPKKKKR